MRVDFGHMAGNKWSESYKDSKLREDIKDWLPQLDIKLDLLLREMSQQIYLLKITWLDYDKTNSNWILFISLTAEIQSVKEQSIVVEEERSLKVTKEHTSSQLANAFIKSICVPETPMKIFGNGKDDDIEVTPTIMITEFDT